MKEHDNCWTTRSIDYNVAVSGQEVTDFNGVYVDRTLLLNNAADSDKATAVWVDANNAWYIRTRVLK